MESKNYFVIACAMPFALIPLIIIATLIQPTEDSAPSTNALIQKTHYGIAIIGFIIFIAGLVCLIKWLMEDNKNYDNLAEKITNDLALKLNNQAQYNYLIKSQYVETYFYDNELGKYCLDQLDKDRPNTLYFELLNQVYRDFMRECKNRKIGLSSDEAKNS